MSTRMAFEGAVARKWIIAGKERGSCVDSARLVKRLLYGKGVYFGLYRTFLLRETSTSDNFGEEGFVERRLERPSSCERKHFPTPPAPVTSEKLSSVV